MLNKCGVHDGELFVERLMSVQMFSWELSAFSVVETRPQIQTFLKHGFYHSGYVSRQKRGNIHKAEATWLSQFWIYQFYKSSFEYNPGATPPFPGVTPPFPGIMLGSLEEGYPMLTNIQIYNTLWETIQAYILKIGGISIGKL